MHAMRLWLALGLSVALLAALVPAPVSTAAAAPSTSVRFAVIGDYGVPTDGAQDVADLVDSWEPDFVVTTGDNNYPTGSATTIDRNIGYYYREYIAPYRGRYGPGADENRFFPSLGNHDWKTNDARPYRDYFTLPGNERYYDTVQGPVHLFILSSDEEEPDGIRRTSKQATWLRQRLAASTAPWKIVVVHHPPFSSGTHGSTRPLQWPYAAWGASAVLSGHDHTYERIMRDGIPYIVNGLGGRSRYDFQGPVAGSAVRYNQDFGALRVEASPARLAFEFVTRTGAVIDRYTMTQATPVAPVASTPQATPAPSAATPPGIRDYLPPTVTGANSPTGGALTWYFAEGSTMPGVDEYLIIHNPNPAAAAVRITYYRANGGPIVKTRTVAGGEQTEVAVHDPTEGIGRGYEVGAKVESTNGVGIVVERPMYFVGGQYRGGHSGLGITTPSATWYFAEGSTAAGFDEYLTLLNPTSQPARVRITYMREQGVPREIGLTIAPERRSTVAVHDPRQGVGRGQEVSTVIESVDGVEIIAERPMYFRYGRAIQGSHNTAGVIHPAGAWYFPEGTTAPGFDQYLTLLNPHPTPALATITYFLKAGSMRTVDLMVGPTSRATIPVHEPGLGVGRGHEVATKVSTTHPDGIVVERPMYFTYGNTITGGHTAAGATAPALAWTFAAASDTVGSDGYLIIMNPHDQPAAVMIYLEPTGGGAAHGVGLLIEPRSRRTVSLDDLMTRLTHSGAESVWVESTNGVGIVAERSVYFVYGKAIAEGHTTLGHAA